jgi:hypothetical protein
MSAGDKLLLFGVEAIEICSLGEVSALRLGFFFLAGQPRWWIVLLMGCTRNPWECAIRWIDNSKTARRGHLIMSTSKATWPSSSIGHDSTVFHRACSSKRKSGHQFLTTRTSHSNLYAEPPNIFAENHLERTKSNPQNNHDDWTMAESRKGGAKAGGGAGNGFQPLGLSDPVYKGIVRMGFRVRFYVVCDLP